MKLVHLGLFKINQWKPELHSGFGTQGPIKTCSSGKIVFARKRVFVTLHMFKQDYLFAVELNVNIDPFIERGKSVVQISRSLIPIMIVS